MKYDQKIDLHNILERTVEAKRNNKITRKYLISDVYNTINSNYENINLYTL